MGEWELAHQEVVSVGKARARIEHALAKALIRALKAECWKSLGLGSFFEYAERFCGLTARQTEERLRVGAAFVELPKLEAALEEGRLPFSAVRELSRVARTDTEAQWIDAAVGKTMREIEDLTAGREPGDVPEDPPRLSARRHRVVLDLSAETFATFREAQAKLRRESDEHVSEDDMILLMARNTLGGPSDAGSSSYQIRMTLCEGCGHASQDGGGMAVTVDAVGAELAQCDSNCFRPGERASQSIPPAIRREIVARHHGRCAVGGCRNATWTDVHHTRLQSEGGTHDPELLILLCSRHHKAAHRGAVVIEGTYTGGFKFLHADGSRYGMPHSPRDAAVISDVFQALRASGFREREARAIVNHVRPHVGGASLEDALRMAFRASHEMRSGAAPT